MASTFRLQSSDSAAYTPVGHEDEVKLLEARSGDADSWASRKVCARAAPLAAAALLVVAVLSKFSDGGAPMLRSNVSGSVGLEAKNSSNATALDVPFCGVVEPNVEYVGIAEVSRRDHVESASGCCTLCQAAPRCRAWTWGGPRKTCRLKHLEPSMGLTRRSDSNVTSGLPFQHPDTSIFCFALAQPFGYEPGLLALQHRERAGIFACDEYGVYSNKSLEVAPGVHTSVVESSLHCEMGGEFKTALNTDIFMAVWAKVVEDGRFQFHDWTVKADPDSVFFAVRLRVAIHFHMPGADDPRGVYLNNCKFGLHGPIEVLSRQAVVSWAGGSEKCVKHFQKLCSGPCMWGEDMFLDQCLKKVLMVTRVDDWNLLSEAHCDSTDWKDCENGAIAFHPFKTQEGYTKCLKAANYGALPSPHSLSVK